MNVWLLIAAINGALAVAAGAFSAHGMQAHYDAHAIDLFETGARYHMYHALAMGLSALAMRGSATQAARLSAIFFMIGIYLFSGSLYLIAVTGTNLLPFAPPVGGFAFLIGWGLLAVAATRMKP